MQQITTQLSDAFTDAKRVTKSHILASNSSMRVVVPIDNKRSVKLKTHQNRGQLIKAKDKNSWKEKVVWFRKSPEETPLGEEVFSQRAIVNNKTHIKTTEQLCFEYGSWSRCDQWKLWDLKKFCEYKRKIE